MDPLVSERNAVSMCWCVVETVLSTIVFVYMVKGAGAAMKDMGIGVLYIKELRNLPSGTGGGYFLRTLFPVYALICTGCAVWSAAWTGMSHALCTSRMMAAVDTAIESIGAGTTSNVNLFEYHDVITIGLRISKVASISALFLFCGVMPVCVIVDQCLANSNDIWSVLNIFTLTWMGVY